MAVRIRENALFERALIASLGVHLLIALFLPAWMPSQSQGLQPVEAISFAHLAHVQLRKPQAAAPAVSMPETVNHANRISFARHKSELSAHTLKPQARPTAVNAPEGKAAAAPRHVALHQTAPLYARAPATAVPVSSSISSAQQTPQPEATLDTHEVAGTGAADRGGVLPFGATQDPVLDPAVLAQLSKRVSHVTLVVTVGEDGRTKNITFRPPLDPDTEKSIEAILADANWDAAVCGGGVSCEGVATIKL